MTMPEMLNLLINPEKPTAKEYILGKKYEPEVGEIINAMNTYCLECLSVYAFSVLLSSAGESTVVKAATFIDNMRKILKFQHEIVTTREERGLGVQASNPEQASVDRAEKLDGKKKTIFRGISTNICMGS